MQLGAHCPPFWIGEVCLLDQKDLRLISRPQQTLQRIAHTLMCPWTNTHFIGLPEEREREGTRHEVNLTSHKMTRKDSGDVVCVWHSCTMCKDGGYCFAGFVVTRDQRLKFPWAKHCLRDGKRTMKQVLALSKFLTLRLERNRARTTHWVCWLSGKRKSRALKVS